MAGVTPDEGLELIERVLRADSPWDKWRIYQVGVGTSTVGVANSDTQLGNEVYRGHRPGSNVAIEDGGQGENTIKISVSGGTEVPAGTTITELGVWAVNPDDEPPIGQGATTEDSKDRMLVRVVRNGVTLEAGDRKTFEIPFLITN